MMLKVLQGCDVFLPDVDGVVNCMHNYCTYLNTDSQVTVVAPKHKNPLKNPLPYEVIRSKSIFLPLLNDYYGFPNTDNKFKKQVMAKEIDIAHFHSPFNMAHFMINVAKKKNIPVVATYHSNVYSIAKDISKSRVISSIICRNVGRAYNKCDEVFVCSPLVEDQLRKHYKYKGKVTYLPFGTELDKCQNISELTELANEEFNLSKDELVFLYVGRVEKLKRIDFILKSLKLLKDKGRKFKFFIVGKGAVVKKLKKLTKKLQLTEEVIFTGFAPRETLPLLYARANLFLFPSLYDNFGLVKVEAAAYSTPALLIENSCSGYGVEDGVNGFLSEDSVTAFAEKIYQATEDLEKLAEIGVQASNDLYINWEECTRQLKVRMEQIIADKTTATTITEKNNDN